MSAGGHLALLAAMAPASAGLDRLCPGNEDLKVAAIVNFFGIVDVLECWSAPTRATSPPAGSITCPIASGWRARCRRSSTCAEGRPPVITVHGDADPVVPFEHARRLTAALDAAGVPNSW